MTKVNSVANSMTRDKYFQIRSNLKVVIDADVSENERNADKLSKIRPLIEIIIMVAYHSQDTARWLWTNKLFPLLGRVT